MKQSLLSLIACPECCATFELHAEKVDNTEIIEGRLVCTACKAEFPIRRGVPRILPSELTREKQATADAFGYEWTHYAALTDADREEFLDWIRPLTPESFGGRVVLDGGCGKGRHIFLAAKFNAREVVGVDLSDAVDSAFANTRQLPNVHVIQADITRLPFAAPFDLAYSIGVLHHLPHPKQGFLSLAKHVKPDGKIAIWVYGKEGNEWITRFVDPVRIHVTSKLPKIITQALSFLLSLPLYLALKLIYGPVLGNSALLKFKSWLPYADYLCAISNYSFAENFWNVFDHLVAPTAFYHSRAEVEDWFAEAKMKDVNVSQRNNNSWRANGIAPGAIAHTEAKTA